MTQTTNYTLPAGKVHFATFSSGETPGPFRYIGNTPELALTVEAENLDHINADSGTREVDDSVALSVTRSGTMVCDDIQNENLALFFFGSVSSVALTAATNKLTELDEVKPDNIIQLGLGLSNRVGDRNVENVFVVHGTALVNGGVYSGTTLANARAARDAAITSPASGDTVLLKYTSGGNTVLRYSSHNGSAWADAAVSTPMVSGTDYDLDANNGLVEFKSSTTVVAAGVDDVQIVYDVATGKYDQVVTGGEPTSGAMRYIEDNPKGRDLEWVFPKVTVRPNGDLALKGTEWRQIPFSITIEKPSSGAAIYCNGEPA